MYTTKVFDYIDFENSDIYKQEVVSKKIIKKVNIQNYEYYLLQTQRISDEQKSPLRGLEADIIVIQEGFDKEYDLFFVPQLHYPTSFKVTQKLNKSIQQEKISGVCYSSSVKKL